VPSAHRTVDARQWQGRRESGEDDSDDVYAIEGRSFLSLWHRTIECSFDGLIRHEERYFLLRVPPATSLSDNRCESLTLVEGIIATALVIARRNRDYV
jgi:hypothetical protein